MNPDQRLNDPTDTSTSGQDRTGRSVGVSLSGAFHTSTFIHIHIISAWRRAERPVMIRVINDTIRVTDPPSTSASVLRQHPLVSPQDLLSPLTHRVPTTRCMQSHLTFGITDRKLKTGSTNIGGRISHM